MKKSVLVCCGTGCLAAGSVGVLDALRRETEGVDVSVAPQYKATGCSGLCESGPSVRILSGDGSDVSYYKVQPKDAGEIISRTVLKGEIIERLCYTGDDGKKLVSQNENPFFSNQKKVALRNVGIIDPIDINDYLERGGYCAFTKALGMSSEEIIAEIEGSGLRGRGGAGFPTAAKWRVGAEQETGQKYIVCNGDEGDPGAFMDGYTMEGDPHSVIEGMLIAALAVGANHGFMYIRDEYALARKNFGIALEAARDNGYLGENINETGFSFDIEIVRGGGAFVCGEETALLESVEGKVGEPRFRPPYPSVSGLWGCPTVTNNVETFANIPVIIDKGCKAFAEVGTEKSKGTKVFAFVGKVKRTGLVEVPMGITLRKLIYDIGGGIRNDRPFKAVQTGGPSGGCIPASMLDLTVDFETLTRHGAMMGSGGMIIMDDTSCMVEVARYYVSFLCEESCGKCTPCREGLRHMLSILTGICEGRGREGDVELLEKIAFTLKEASLCALGKTAANPVLTTIKYFRNEYDAHIRESRCEAGMCRQMTVFCIDAEKCTGCGVCAKLCSANAISGGKKEKHSIDATLCSACGICRDRCKFNAVFAGRRNDL